MAHGVDVEALGQQALQGARRAREAQEVQGAEATPAVAHVGTGVQQRCYLDRGQMSEGMQSQGDLELLELVYEPLIAFRAHFCWC